MPLGRTCTLGSQSVYYPGFSHFASVHMTSGFSAAPQVGGSGGGAWVAQ